MGSLLFVQFQFLNEELFDLVACRVDRESLKQGDHIYSWRAAYIYAHHGSLLALSILFLFSFLDYVCIACCIFRDDSSGIKLSPNIHLICKLTFDLIREG